MTKQGRRIKRLLALSGEEALSAAELEQRLLGLTFDEGSRLAAVSSYHLVERPLSGWWAGQAHRNGIVVTTTDPGRVITSAWSSDVRPAGA